MNLLNLFWEIFLFEICFYGLSVGAVNNKTILCYLNRLATNIPGNFRFAVDDINPNLCTHIVYSRLSLDIENNEIIKDLHFYNWHKKFTELKAKNHQLKVLIDLVPKPEKWNDTHIKLMVNSSHVEAIARNTVAFLQLNKFDGITIEFYPFEDEKIGFMNLVGEMRKAFLSFGYFLAVTGALYESRIEVGYDFPSLSKDIDFLILNAYNFYTPNKVFNRADHHAPLYQRPWDTENYTVNFTVNHWISKGFPPEKILLGILLGSNSWTLSSDDSTPPAPAKGPGPPAIYTEQDGVMSYFEICLNVVNKGWQVYHDPEKRMGPYAVSTDKENKIWVGYDDPAMAVIKSKYILSNRLGGVAVWDVSMDDFRNKCGGGFNPMLTAIRKTLCPDTLPSITLKDLEDLLFREKVAFIFSLIVSSCSFLTFVYMLFWLYSLEAICKSCFQNDYAVLIFEV